jgi:polyisoprenoid-binding protein YceI
MSGLTARLRSRDGWAVASAVLTVTDLAGRQAGRADSNEDGVAVTGALAAGTYTAIVMAPGYDPAARTVVVPASGSATLGTVTLDRAAGDLGLPPAGKWSVDPVHSSVTITARHLGMASVSATIGDFSATIVIGEPAETSTVQAVLRTESVNTGNKMRDDHLRSPDFFDAAAFPEITYEGTSVTAAGGDRWTVNGDLSLHGIAKPAGLDLAYLGTSPDPWGGLRAGFRATAELNRKDFRVEWQEILPNGALMLPWTIQVTLNIEAVQGDLPPMPDA